MKNLFRELNMISVLIEQNKYELENLLKYQTEIISKQYQEHIEYQKEEDYVNYMNFTEYSKKMAMILKQIVKEVMKNIKNKEKTIQKLTFLKEYLIYKAIFLSRVSIPEMIEIINLFHSKISLYIIEENPEYIEILERKEGELTINLDIASSYPKELIDFLMYLINEKSKDLFVNPKEVFQDYERGKEKSRYQVLSKSYFYDILLIENKRKTSTITKLNRKLMVDGNK